MSLFKEENGKLKSVKIIPLTKERSLQLLIESNLLEVLEMHFLASEYTTTANGRIDTLAIDMNGAPVIIEYKRNQNDNIITQSLWYLAWLKAQKVDFFEMLVLKKLGKEVANELKIDWQNPRIICIAESYSKYDIHAVEEIKSRLELFTYRYYDDGIFSLEGQNISKPSIIKPTIKTGKNSSEQVINSQELLIDLTNSKTFVQQLFTDLQARILELDENIVEKENTNNVVFRLSKNFVEVRINKEHLRLLLRPVEYIDPLNMVEKVPDTFRWSLNSKLILKHKDELDYVVKLIEQSYQDVK